MATRHDQIPITPLLVLGGQSSRMGTPKHLLSFPDNRPAYQHALETLRSAVPLAEQILISCRHQEQFDSLSEDLERFRSKQISQIGHEDHGSISFKYIPVVDSTKHGDIGPAAGLLAAHHQSPGATLMVLGCDYPLLPASALLQLILEYEPPVTCFLSVDEQSGKEFCEPLVSIWAPEALDKLEEEVGRGMSGLNRIVKMLGGKKIRPLRDAWIMGCNTPEEWEKALAILRAE